MSNFTLDDTDPALSYSGDDWGVQLSDDPDVVQFFDSTYHATTVDGASVSFQFSGSAFALYGSKGPHHGRFQVQFDNTVVTNLDASAPSTEFRQILFAHAFPPADAGTHTVKVTAVFSGANIQGRWLDVDYITFASGNASSSEASSFGTVTSAPPWLESSSGGSAPTSSSSNTAVHNFTTFTPSPAQPSKVPTILAALFGALIGLAALAFAAYLLLRRAYDRRRARERVFRYGQSSANPAATASLAGTAPVSYSHVDAPGPGAPFSPVRAHAHAASEASGYGGEMRTVSSAERAGTPTTGGGAGRPLLGAGGRAASTSPIAWTRQKVGGKAHRGDADSLRTDFLQV